MLKLKPKCEGEKIFHNRKTKEERVWVWLDVS